MIGRESIARRLFDRFVVLMFQREADCIDKGRSLIASAGAPKIPTEQPIPKRARETLLATM